MDPKEAQLSLTILTEPVFFQSHSPQLKALEESELVAAESEDDGDDDDEDEEGGEQGDEASAAEAGEAQPPRITGGMTLNGVTIEQDTVQRLHLALKELLPTISQQIDQAQAAEEEHYKTAVLAVLRGRLAVINAWLHATAPPHAAE